MNRIYLVFFSVLKLELFAGKLTRLLVGARNNGSQSYLVESIDGSLRYPQDYSYYIQNFTSLRTEQVVEPGLESTFEYLFMPSETFNGRPMGLVVLLNYRNNVNIKRKEKLRIRFSFSCLGRQTFSKRYF